MLIFFIFQCLVQKLTRSDARGRIYCFKSKGYDRLVEVLNHLCCTHTLVLVSVLVPNTSILDGYLWDTPFNVF